MKQLILLTAILLISTVSFAEDTTTETCANGAGTVIEGAVADANGNKHKYCISNKTMNWWNAVSWCDALGKKLFSLEDCGCSGTTNCTDRCPELYTKIEAYAWTATPKGENSAHFVYMTSASTNNGARMTRSNQNVAVCK